MKKVIFILLLSLAFVPAYTFTLEEAQTATIKYYQKLSDYAFNPDNPTLAASIKDMILDGGSIYSDINSHIKQLEDAQVSISTYLAMLEDKNNKKYAFTFEPTSFKMLSNSNNILILFYTLNISSYDNKKNISYNAEITFNGPNIVSIAKCMRFVTVNPSAQINNISVVQNQNLDDGKGLVIKVSFNVQNMLNKKGQVVAYFYDNDGNALLDQNNKYNTSGSNPKVVTYTNIAPGSDNAQYTDLKLSIPYNELHQSGTYTRTLKFKICIWDKSISPSNEFYSDNTYTTFSYTPPLETYLTINGSTTDKTRHFYEYGGRETYNVSTSASSYDIWGVPSWCNIENKTATSFTLVCEPNTSSSARSDYIKVKTAGKEIRIDIKQDCKITAPSLSVNPTNLSFDESGGTRTITVTSNSKWIISSQPAWWSHITYNDNTITIQINTNKSTSNRYSSFTIQATNSKGSIQETISISQSGRPETKTEKWWNNSVYYPQVYLEGLYGIGINDNWQVAEHYVGGNFAVIPHTIGGQVSALYGIRQGDILATLSPLFTVTSWPKSPVDLQLWAGAGVAFNKSNIKNTLSPAADIGMRIGWDAAFDYRIRPGFGFWSLSVGAKYYDQQVFPTIGLSLIPVGALVDGADYFWDSSVLPNYYMETNIGALIGGNGTDLMIGLTNSWQSFNTGIYVTGQIGVFNLSWSVIAGPIFRLTPNRDVFDCSLYGGAGYGVYNGRGHSKSGVAGDLGIRFAWDQSGRNFGFWSFSLGCQNIAGAWEPYCGINIVITGLAATAYLCTWMAL